MPRKPKRDDVAKPIAPESKDSIETVVARIVEALNGAGRKTEVHNLPASSGRTKRSVRPRSAVLH